MRETTNPPNSRLVGIHGGLDGHPISEEFASPRIATCVGLQ